MALFRLAVPDSLDEVTVAQLRLGLAQEDLIVHLLQVLVTVRALHHEFVLFLSLPRRLGIGLGGNEHLVLLLLLFVHVAPTGEPLRDLFKRRGHLCLLAQGVGVLLPVELPDLTFEDSSKRFLHDCARGCGSLLLSALEL